MMRNATKGWTAKILLLLLVASFAVWGVSGSMLTATGAAVISVGNSTVTPLEYRLAYDRQLNELQRRFGSRITREQADSLGLSANVMTQLVSGALLDENARELGLGMSDESLAAAIGEDPAFQDATGRFSRVQLDAVLRSIGMREAQYVETRRAVALRNQLIETATGKANLPDAFWKIVDDYQAEERKFNFVTVTSDDIKPVAEPTAAALEEFYEANKADYIAPEFRKLNIVKLEAEDIADPSTVSDEDVAAEYEARKDSFSEAEQRTIEQLVFTDSDKAQAALDALAGGATFEQIVEEAGKSLSDISLGTLPKSDIPDTAIADAAFELGINTPSEVVPGLFGPVILRVTEIMPGSTRPLSEVEGELRSALALQRATDDLFETYDRLEDERAAGEDLAGAARAVQLSPRVIEAVDRTARDPEGNIIADIPQSQELLAEAFETDEGVETDPISIGADGFVWFEVAGVTEERQKTLDEVRDQVRDDWFVAERANAIDELAEEIRSRLSDGADFNDVINELMAASPPQATQGLSLDGTPEASTATARVVQQSIPLQRTSTTPQLPQSAVSAGFAIPKGAVTIASGANEGERIVLQVVDIASGDRDGLSEADRSTFNLALSDDIISQLVTRLESDYDVEINQQAINAALAY